MTDRIKERIEGASEGSRELDADIAVALEGGEIVWKQGCTMEPYPAIRRPSPNHVGGYANEHCPHFTSSLDAALTLVERMLPGWSALLLRDAIEELLSREIYPSIARLPLMILAGLIEALTALKDSNNG